MTSLPRGEFLKLGGRLLEAALLLVEDAHVLEVAEELTIGEGVLDDRLDRRREVGLARADLLEEVEELLVAALALEAVEDRLELLLDRLVLLLHARDDRRRVLVLADGEGDDGLEDVRLGIERVREVRRLDRVDVAERVRVVAGHEVGPRLLEERVEPVLAADVDAVPVLDGCGQLLRVDLRDVVVVEAHRRRVVGARHRQVGEVAHAGLVLDALGALVERLMMRWNDFTAGTDLRSWTYEMPVKNWACTKYGSSRSTFSKRLIASS
jgi:hypothetical protein